MRQNRSRKKAHEAPCGDTIQKIQEKIAGTIRQLGGFQRSGIKVVRAPGTSREGAQDQIQPAKTLARIRAACQSSQTPALRAGVALARRATIQISRFSTFVENRHLPRASPFGAQFGRLGRPEATGDPVHINLMVFSGACSRPFSDSKNRNFVLFPELAPLSEDVGKTECILRDRISSEFMNCRVVLDPD
eukprot:COSAG03_NODE_766_length_5956_cov_19.214699_1_plen_190_part_00